MAGDRDFVPLLVTWWSGTRKREALDIELCTNSRLLSRIQAEPYLPPVMSRECYFFVDLAETVLNFGSNPYPGATGSKAGRREPLQGVTEGSPEAGHSQQHHPGHWGAVSASHIP